MASNISIDLSSLGISWSLGESYRFAMDQGFVFASTGLKLPVSGNTNIRTFYAPNTAPAISSTYPVNYESASDENEVIDLGFDRDIVSNDLDVHLYKIDSPNVLVKSYTIANTYTASANNSVAGISGGNIKLPINLLLEPNTSYYVLTDANVVQDLDGFNFDGITTSNIWTWTTSTDFQLELTNVVPQNYFEDGNTAILSPKIIKDVYSIISEEYPYTVTITSNISNSVKQLYADAPWGSGTAVWADPTLTLVGGADEVNTRLNNLLLIPEDDYTGNITLFYTLTTPSSNVYTREQLVTNAGVNDEFGNVVGISRYYWTDENSYIFESSTPYIDDGLASENINDYAISIDTFGQGNVRATGYSIASNITITGNKSTVNSLLSSVEYVPDSGFSSNINLGYTQTRNGTAQITSNIALNNTGLKAIEYLAVAGGGGGGANMGGGGGGGGLLESYFLIPSTGNTYVISIGAGGAGGTGGGSPNYPASSGGNTTITNPHPAFANIICVGGGGGGFGGTTNDVYSKGRDGGSAGGSSTDTANAAIGIGTPVSGQGNYGGRGVGQGFYIKGGGGGGAAGDGHIGILGNANTASSFGNGGAAIGSSITGNVNYYAGGGGGGAFMNVSIVGYGTWTAGHGGNIAGVYNDPLKGGGGDGRASNPDTPWPNNTLAVGYGGIPNTGGGQGGGTGGAFHNYNTDDNGLAGAGGSGVVILRLHNLLYTGNTTGSPTVTTDGDYTILKYTTSGTYSQ